MRIIKKHYEKILLAIFVLAVCGWGGYHLLAVNTLKDKIVAKSAVQRHMGKGETKEILTAEDFTAHEFVSEPKTKWVSQQNEDEASLVRPPALIACVNPDCTFWLPADTPNCPNCGAAQGDDVLGSQEDITPVEQRVFFRSVRREAFGAVLQSVIGGEEQPVEEWSLQFDVVRADGRRRTSFAGKGETLNVAGREYKIIEVRKLEESRYSPAVDDEVTVDVSEVDLRGPQGKIITLVRGQRKYADPAQVTFTIVDPDDPSETETKTIDADETLELFDNEGEKQEYLIDVRSRELVVLKPVDNPEAEGISLNRTERLPEGRRTIEGEGRPAPGRFPGGRGTIERGGRPAPGTFPRSQ